MHLCILLYKSELVASAKTILQEKRASDTLQLALTHDSNAIAEYICFVHIVRRQNYDLVLLVGF